MGGEAGLVWYPRTMKPCDHRTLTCPTSEIWQSLRLATGSFPDAFPVERKCSSPEQVCAWGASARQTVGNAAGNPEKDVNFLSSGPRWVRDNSIPDVLTQEAPVFIQRLRIPVLFRSAGTMSMYTLATVDRTLSYSLKGRKR